MIPMAIQHRIWEYSIKLCPVPPAKTVDGQIFRSVTSRLVGGAVIAGAILATEGSAILLIATGSEVLLGGEL